MPFMNAILPSSWVKRAIFVVGVLCCCIDTPTASAQNVTGADITAYGIFGGQTHSAVVKPGPFKSLAPRLDAKLIKQTQIVPATLNTKFGISFVVHGTPKGTRIPVQNVILFPPRVDPNTGKTKTRSVDTTLVKLEEDQGVGIYEGFSHLEQSQLGTWTFQVFFSGKKLLEKKFTVVKS